MRAEPYDVLDTPPDTAIPNTLFVPMFWPDEPDTSSDYWNNYLSDGVSGSGSTRQKNLTKYNKSSPGQISWHSNRKDTTFPYDYGPNRGCPRPITPLTTDEIAIEDAIDDMTPHAATGTFIPMGLVWGWHVLSPGEPFTEGLGPGEDDFDKTIKALILLSDGANSPTVNDNDNHNQSTFSAYNYTATAVDNVVNGGHVYRRLQNVNVNSNPSNATATANLNAKTATLCTNVKNDQIRLYTITFGSMDSTATNLMRNCASRDDEGSPLYFHAPDSDGLQQIFDAIGDDLNNVRLSM
jgi:hypothetical protein